MLILSFPICSHQQLQQHNIDTYMLQKNITFLCRRGSQIFSSSGRRRKSRYSFEAFELLKGTPSTPEHATQENTGTHTHRHGNAQPPPLHTTSSTAARPPLCHAHPRNSSRIPAFNSPPNLAQTQPHTPTPCLPKHNVPLSARFPDLNLTRPSPKIALFL